jgi:succinyl-CoA synthetase beta subunit
MKLFEFEGKSLFRKTGIPIPNGEVAASAPEAKTVADRIGYPVVVKGQVLRGGRGKAGGIQFADTESELLDVVDRLLHTKIADEKVEKILIEQKIKSSKEFYAGITQDPDTLMPMLITSPKGGMDIETIAETAPEHVFKQILDPTKTYRLYHMMDLVSPMELGSEASVKVAKVLLGLIHCFFRFEATTAEINPLILSETGEICAADSKFEIDDSALYRVKESKSFQRAETLQDPLEAEAKDAGVAYVPMKDGNIGIISGGAGLAMASMDLVSVLGGKPANFLDLGGGTTPKRAAAALNIVLKTPGVEGVLFNVFGGINNCEEMAKGIARVIDEKKPSQAIVVKMRGYSQEEGWEILESRDISIVKHGTTEDAVKQLLEEMK